MNTSTVNQAAESGNVQSYDNTKTTSKNERTIGSPKLSDKAQKYYEQLQKKFGNMDFVLVANDEKENAEAKAAKYARAGRLQVLIDEEKLERMAEDEAYRKKYEGIITNAQTQLNSMQKDIGKQPGVKTYGMRIDDHGNASFFAVIDKSLAAQRERIEEKAEQKAEDKKKAAKAEQKEKYEKILKGTSDEEDLVTVTADSVYSLMKKINETILGSRSDNVQTDWEKMVGQHIDYRQ